MALADRSAATALKLLTKYGQNVTLRRVTVKGAYNSATGKTAAPTTAEVTVKAHPTDFNSGNRSANTQVNTGDKLILIAGSSISRPQIGDTITIGSDRYTIVPRSANGQEVEAVVVSGITVLYKIHGRLS